MVLLPATRAPGPGEHADPCPRRTGRPPGRQAALGLLGRGELLMPLSRPFRGDSRVFRVDATKARTVTNHVAGTYTLRGFRRSVHTTIHDAAQNRFVVLTGG